MREKQGCTLTVGAGVLQVWIHREVSLRGICEIFGKGLQLKSACGIVNETFKRQCGWLLKAKSNTRNDAECSRSSPGGTASPGVVPITSWTAQSVRLE